MPLPVDKHERKAAVRPLHEFNRIAALARGVMARLRGGEIGPEKRREL
jgi:hypothetical protein